MSDKRSTAALDAERARAVPLLREVREQLRASVAERTRMEDRLENSQALLRMAGRLSRMGAWSVDLPGLGQTWSDEVCAIHEVPPGTVVSVEQGLNFYAPEFREAIARPFAACVAEGTPYDVELQIVTAAGRRVWVRSIGEAVRGADGRIHRVQGACQDISERKAAEAEVRELADRLTAMLETLPDGFFTLDREWRFTYVNREAERMFMLPRAELLGHGIWDMFPEARDSIFHREYARAFRDNVAVQFETAYQPMNVWFEARAFPSAQGLAVHFRDITARHHADEALRELRRNHDLIVNAITQGIHWIDGDGRIILENSASARMLGWEAADLIGQPAHQTMHHTHVNGTPYLKSECPIYAGLTTGIARRVDDEVFWRKDGTSFPVEYTTTPVRGDQGETIGAVVVFTDITERTRAEIALRHSLEEFRTLAEVVPQLVWITRPDGGNIYFNQRWIDYTGLTLEQSQGHGWVTPFHPDDQERARVAWQMAIDTVGIYSIECRIRRADGVYRWWLIRGVPLRDVNGDVAKWFGTCTDIHDMKLAELEVSRTNAALQAEVVERTRAEDAAEAANRSKSEFLANMSHEIRTPLNGVVGMTALMLGTDLTAEQREYLSMARASGESLLTVINDILDFSKIEAGQLTVDALAFDLPDCLATTVKVLGPRAQVKGLALACEIHPNVPPALVGDCGRLCQIVTNLMGNAIKFTARGEVALTVRLEARTGGDVTLRFSVSDTGIGIRREQQEAIFKPFVQADGTTTREYGGTGLGLAISTNLVALLGGRMWLESEPGRGSTFHFTARFDLRPAAGTAPGAPAQAVAPQPPQPRQQALRILLAEDNRVNQMVAARLLGKRGHTVVITENGKEALAALADPGSGGFDLILMDVHMPEMDGFEATGIIRAREAPSGVRLPIIAMTALAMKGDEARCLAAGMDGYVAKPIDVDLLLAAIDRVLAWRR